MPQVQNLDVAMKAALKGPEKKLLKIFGHEFNVKPCQISRNGQKLIINGQLSHCLTLRPDDQFFYTIVKENGIVKDLTFKIDRGGAAPFVAPIISAVGTAILKVPIPADKVEAVGHKLGQALNGGWEEVAQLIASNIALRAN